MSNDTIPLPEPRRLNGESEYAYEADQMHAHAAAVSAYDNATLREAVKHYEAALKARWPEGAKGESFEHWNAARAALGDKNG